MKRLEMCCRGTEVALEVVSLPPNTANQHWYYTAVPLKIKGQCCPLFALQQIFCYVVLDHAFFQTSRTCTEYWRFEGAVNLLACAFNGQSCALIWAKNDCPFQIPRAFA